MKTLPGRDTSATMRSTAPLAAKVCMHVLGITRTDVRVMRAASALVEAGFSVTVVDIDWKNKTPVEEDIDGIQVKHVITPHWYTSRRFKPWFLLQALWMFIRCTLRLLQTPADVYHAHDAKALPACYLAAQLRGKRLIFDAHELPLSEEATTTRWQGLIGMFSNLLALMVPHCSAVITVSAPIAQEIHRHYAGPEVTLIRNIPPYQTAEKSDRLRQYLGLRPDTRIALYQGSLGVSRGLDRIIRAARFLEKDIILILMGPDTEGMQARHEALICSEGVTDRVKIVPSVPYAELLAWTASADIGLLIYAPDQSQNVQMCLPNKLFEYLMVGLPVLASELEAVAGILTTYNVGRIISTLEPADIAGAINAVLADHLAYAHMRQNALAASQQDLRWEKECQQLIRLYNDVLTRPQ